jgi:uncharacterized protein DUF997
MTTPSKPPDKEQQLLRHARREGLLIMALWAVCMIWSMTVGYFMGYRRTAAEMSLILGIPDWIFWSVVVPWGLCLAFSVWFCFMFMADDDLGQDQELSDG